MKPKYIVAAIFIAMAFIVADCTSSAHAEWVVDKGKDRYGKTICFAYQGYSNDWRFFIYVYDNLDANLAVIRDSWDIPDEIEKTIYFSVDKESAWKADAQVNNPENMEGAAVTTGISYESLYEITKGRVLKLSIGNQYVELDLKGSGEAIRKTLECAKKLPQSNPFGTISNPSNPFDI